MQHAVCDGAIIELVDGSLSCSTGWVFQVSPIPFDASQVDPTIATAMFGAGFALFIGPWAVAWGVFQILKIVR